MSTEKVTDLIRSVPVSPREKFITSPNSFGISGKLSLE
jgi:hypothetical protein